MKKILCLLILINSTSTLWAHKPHSHSSGRAQIAFDQLTGVFELELPAIAVVGFEHRPKNPVQKVKLQKSLDQLKNSTSQILAINPAPKCSISNPQSQVIYSGKKETHSEVKLTAEIKCSTAPLISHFRVTVLKMYPKIEKVEVQTLMGDAQNSFILEGEKETLN